MNAFQGIQSVCYFLLCVFIFSGNLKRVYHIFNVNSAWLSCKNVQLVQLSFEICATLFRRKHQRGSSHILNVMHTQTHTHAHKSFGRKNHSLTCAYSAYTQIPTTTYTVIINETNNRPIIHAHTPHRELRMGDSIRFLLLLFYISNIY